MVLSYRDTHKIKARPPTHRPVAPALALHSPQTKSTEIPAKVGSLAKMPPERFEHPFPIIDPEISPQLPEPLPPIPIYRRGIIYPDLDHYIGNNPYPPDWEARKAAVKERDQSRCQVSGCPSYCELDVHHINPVHTGGSHELENLVCLCRVHHWLLPSHALVAERTDNERFVMRRAHQRWNVAHTERINVKATFERHRLATVADCQRINELCVFSCKDCNSIDLYFAQINDALIAACLNCYTGWKAPKLLPEELGTIYAAHFPMLYEARRFPFDLDYLPDRVLKKVALCDACAAEGRIGIFREVNGPYGKFWGCSNFRTEERCKNTRPWLAGR